MEAWAARLLLVFIAALIVALAAIRFKLAIRSLDFPPGIFSIVRCSNVLDHIGELDVALKEVKRVLKPVKSSLPGALQFAPRFEMTSSTDAAREELLLQPVWEAHASRIRPADVVPNT